MLQPILRRSEHQCCDRLMYKVFTSPRRKPWGASSLGMQPAADAVGW